jgi:hypothetical protein
MIIKLAEFLDRRVFEQLAGEILREINTQVKDVAAQYEVTILLYEIVEVRLLPFLHQTVASLDERIAASRGHIHH